MNLSHSRILALVFFAALFVGACSGGSSPGTTDLKVSIDASPVSGTAPLEVTFRAIIVTGSASGFTWDFGDDSEDGSGEEVTHRYTGAGSYRVTLFANGGGDALAQATINITVSEGEPFEVAAITADPTRGIVPLTVQFGVELSGGVEPFTYSWDFGDTSVSFDAAPEHVFDEIGTYDVSVIVMDAAEATGSADIEIAVVGENEAPVAEDSTVTTDEDIPVDFVLDVTDADEDDLEFTIVTEPTRGALSGDAPNLTYTPDAEFSGDDSFTFTASDGIADSETATVSITVNSVNDVPVADAQELTTAEETPLDITLTATDPDNADLTFRAVSDPANGALTGDSPTFTYTPNTGFHGLDTFNFVANDGTADSEIAVVSITVTGEPDPPIANDMELDTDEDTPLDITLDGEDPDEDTLTFSVGTPSSGSLTGLDTATGDVTFNPATNFSGDVTFEYTVNDGTASATGNVTVTVNPVNDVPVAQAANKNGTEDQNISFVLLATDVETSAGSLTFEVTNDPDNGTLEGTAPILTYVPNNNFNGADTIQFTANDGTDTSEPATITFNLSPVNDAPVALDQLELTTPEETPLAITMTATDVDLGDGTMQFLVEALPGSGQGTFDRDLGSLYYTEDPVITLTPADGYNGEITFQFKAYDGALFSEAGTITVDVTEQNDPPVANDDPGYEVAEGAGTLRVTAEQGVLANDTEPEGEGITAELVDGLGEGEGSVELLANGSFTYTLPDSDFNGTVTFTYDAVDERALHSETPATVTITVNPVNDAPVATGPATAEVYEDQDLTITPVGTDVDTPEGELTFYIDQDSLPVNGSLAGIVKTPSAVGDHVGYEVTADLVYSPERDYPHHNSPAGEDSFKFFVYDGTATSGLLEVAITVRPVNDRPTADDKDLVVVEQEGGARPPVSFELTGDDADEDDTLVFTITKDPDHGTLEGDIPNLTFIPAMGSWGDGEPPTDTIQYVANDSRLPSAPATITFTLRDRNQIPEAVGANVSTDEDDPLVITLEGTDLDGDILEFEIVDALPEGAGRLGRIEVVGQEANTTRATVTYTPALNYNNTMESRATFTFKVIDGAAAESDTAEVAILVNATNDPPTISAVVPLSVAEGAVAGILEANLNADDVDNPDSVLTFTIADLPSLGEIWYGNPDTRAITHQLYESDTFTQAQISAENIFYRHLGAEPGESGAEDAMRFTLTDGVEGTTPLEGTLRFNITTLNDAPVLAVNAVLPVDEHGDGANVHVTDATLRYTDEESPPSGLTYTIIDGLPGTEGDVGKLFLGDARLLNHGTFTQADLDPAAAVKLTYRYGGAEPGAGVEHRITLGLADDGRYTGSEQRVSPIYLDVEVTPVNDPPVFVTGVGNQEFGEDPEDPITVPFTVWDAETDAADLVVTATATSGGALFDGENGLSVIVIDEGDFNRAVVIDPDTDENGGATVQLMITDDDVSDPRTKTSNFTVNVTEVNDAPVAVDDTLGAYPEDDPAVIAQTVLTTNDTDIDNTVPDDLSVVNVTKAVNGSVGFDESGNVVFTPTPNYYGAANFRYVVSDGVDSGSRAGLVTLTITDDMDDTPVIDPIEDQSALQDSAFSLSATASDPDDEDIDQWLLFVVIEGVATVPPDDFWLSLAVTDDPNEASLSGIPGSGDVGEHLIRLEVEDAANHIGAEEFTITVGNVNDDPIWDGPSSVAAIEDPPEDTPNIITIAAHDPDENPISYRVVPADDRTAACPTGPQYGTVVQDETAPNVFIYDVSDDFTGTDDFADCVEFELNDTFGWTGPYNVTINVTATNDPPTITSIEDQTLREDLGYKTRIYFTIDDVESTVNLTNMTSQVCFRATFEGTPICPDTVYSTGVIFGEYDGRLYGTVDLQADKFTSGDERLVVTFTVTDPDYGTASSTFDALVEGRNDAPIIDATIVQSPDPANEDEGPVTLTFTGRDHWGETTTSLLIPGATVTSDPNGVVASVEAIYGGSGEEFLATVNLNENEYGTVGLSLSLRDRNDTPATTSVPYTLTVNSVNDAPWIDLDLETEGNQDEFIVDFPTMTPAGFTIDIPFALGDDETPKGELIYLYDIIPYEGDGIVALSAEFSEGAGDLMTATVTISPDAVEGDRNFLIMWLRDGPSGDADTLYGEGTVVLDAGAPVISSLGCEWGRWPWSCGAAQAVAGTEVCGTVTLLEGYDDDAVQWSFRQSYGTGWDGWTEFSSEPCFATSTMATDVEITARAYEGATAVGERTNGWSLRQPSPLTDELGGAEPIAAGGWSAVAPSNTVAAIGAAFAAGAYAVQIDVHTPMDGVVNSVAYPSETILPDSGCPEEMVGARISDQSYTSLQRCNPGLGFDGGGGRRFTYDENADQIPIVEDLITYLKLIEDPSNQLFFFRLNGSTAVQENQSKIIDGVLSTALRGRTVFISEHINLLAALSMEYMVVLDMVCALAEDGTCDPEKGPGYLTSLFLRTLKPDFLFDGILLHQEDPNAHTGLEDTQFAGLAAIIGEPWDEDAAFDAAVELPEGVITEDLFTGQTFSSFTAEWHAGVDFTTFDYSGDLDSRNPERVGELVATGDVTGDGFEDLVICSAQGGANGTGHVSIDDGIHPIAELAVPTGFTFCQSMVVGNVDEDPADEVIVGALRGTVGSVAVYSIPVGEGYVPIGGSLPTADRTFTDGLLDGLVSSGKGFGAGIDGIGQSLELLNIDGDANLELAIGAPDASLVVSASQTYRGGVVIVIDNVPGKGLVHDPQYGGASMAITSQYVITYGSTIGKARECRVGVAEDFGFSLAAGDFSGNGFDQLAIGDPNQEDTGKDETGAAVDGGAVAVVTFSGFLITIRSPSCATYGLAEDVLPTDQQGAQMGYSLATGRFFLGCKGEECTVVTEENTITDGLAIGMPGFDSDGYTDNGAVLIFPGDSKNRLWKDAYVLVTQDSYGILTEAGLTWSVRGAWSDSYDGEQFGFSLTSAQINGDYWDDLAIGSPYDSVRPMDGDPEADVGTLLVIPGSRDFWRSFNDARLLRPGYHGLFTSPVETYNFGYSAAFGHVGYDQGAIMDFFIGMPGWYWIEEVAGGEDIIHNDGGVHYMEHGGRSITIY